MNHWIPSALLQLKCLPARSVGSQRPARAHIRIFLASSEPNTEVLWPHASAREFLGGSATFQDLENPAVGAIHRHYHSLLAKPFDATALPQTSPQWIAALRSLSELASALNNSTFCSLLLKVRQPIAAEPVRSITHVHGVMAMQELMLLASPHSSGAALASAIRAGTADSLSLSWREEVVDDADRLSLRSRGGWVHYWAHWSHGSHRLLGPCRTAGDSDVDLSRAR